MSQLDSSGLPNDPRGFRRSQPVPQVEQIVSPELRTASVPLTSVAFSRGEQMAAQLEQALGATGTAFANVGRVAESYRAETDRQQAESARRARMTQAEKDRETAQAEAADRVAASTTAAKDYEGLAHDIEQRNLTIPDGMKVEDFAHMLTENARGRENSGIFNSAYDSHVEPRLIRDLYKQQDAIQSQKSGELLSMASDQAILARTPEDVQKALDDARKIVPHATDTELLTGIIQPAVISAAKAGDRTRLDAALSVLGDRLPDVRRQAEAVFNSAQTQHQARALDGFQNDVAKMYVDNQPKAMIEQRIMDYSNRKIVPPKAIEAELGHLNAHFADEERKNLSQSLAAFDQYIFSDALTRAGPAMDSGTFIPGDVHYTRPDGKEQTITAKELVEAARTQRFASFDQQFSPTSQDPAVLDQNLAAKIGWLSKNPSARDPQMQGLFSGISSRITATTDPKTVPPTALAAFHLFQRADQLAPGVATAHMNSGDLEFMRHTEANMETLPGTTVGEAMVRASRRMGEPGDATQIKASIPEKSVIKAVSSVGAAKNDGLAQNIVRKKAEAYIASAGLSPERALEKAKDDFAKDFLPVNGFWIDRRQNPIVDQVDLPAISTAVVGSFLKANPDSGYSADNLTLRPDRKSGVWTLSVGDGAAVPEGITFTDADLQSIQAAVVLKQRDDSIGKIESAIAGKRASNTAGANRTLRARADTAAIMGGTGTPESRDIEAEARSVLKLDEIQRRFDALPKRPSKALPKAAVPDRLKSVIDFINNPPAPHPSTLPVPGQRTLGT